MNNKKIGFGIVGIIVLVAVFYGGVSYGKTHAASSTQTATTGVFGGGAGGFRGARGGSTGVGGAAGGFTIGQVLSKDATSITVSLMGGGSKIIFYDSGTKISKTVTGTPDDLTAGTQVTIMGTANSDGSMNATSVQIRPNMPTTPPTTTPAGTPVVQ